MNMPAPAGRPVAHPFTEPPSGAQAVEVAAGILWMRLPLPMILNHVNVYALDDGDGWTLVDTGFDTASARATWEAILAGPLAGRPVRRVVLTHYHPDHVGLAGWFRARGAEIWATRTTWLFARMLTLDVQEKPVPETLDFWRRAGMDAQLLERRRGERPFNFGDVVAPIPLGYRRIAEGDSLTMGGREWLVRTGNGHAPEHATFWSLSDSLVISGDQVLPKITPNIGVYATEPEADPLADWLASTRALAGDAREDHFVLPGHRLPFTGLPARLSEMLSHHDAALARVLDVLDRPATAADCFPAIYGREIGGFEYGLALVEAVAHLNHLWHAGQVTRRIGDNGAWLWQRSESARAGNPQAVAHPPP